MKIPVVGPTYKLDARTFDTQRCVNLFPEISESGDSKNVARLVGTPGLRLFATAGGGPIRGSFTTAGERCFVVSGDTLYELTSTGTATSRGTLNTAIGRVSIAENGTQMMIVDGTNGYIFTLATNSLAVIADAQYPDAATIVGYQDTYFIVNNPGTGDFYISANNDGTSWTATDKTTVESSPDNLVSLLSDHGELFLFGEKTVEVYYNSGNASFPFDRISQAIMQVGCAAAHTPQSFDNNVVWLGEDTRGGRFIWSVSDAYRPVRISTQAVEEALASVDDVSDAYAWTYKQKGHEFYCLQVPGLMSTWVYDAATQLWHERSYFNPALNREERHLGATFTYFGNKSLVGDRDSGKIYELKLNHYTDNGTEIHRIRITPHLSNEMKRVFITDLMLDMETGVGLTDGTDPKVMLQVSKDGGRTFGDERWKSFGKLGAYKTRAKWNRLGSSRDWVFKFKITDAVQVSISDCYAQVTPGIY